MLANCFEKTFSHYIVKATAYLGLEIKECDNFIKAFNSLEDFIASDEDLITATIAYSMAINFNI